MNDMLDSPDPQLLRLRRLVAGVDRSCPSCTRAIVFEATRCRYCWVRSDA